MKFKYQDHGGVLRPVIPIVLSYGGKSFNHEVLVDSGSDRCFFDAEVLVALGITKQKGTFHDVFGIGGSKSSSYYHPITMTVGDISYDIEAGFIPLLGGGLVSYGFVGQKGFFDRFIVKFDLPRREVVLVPAKK
jgi:hypothetical protein